jgi:hypothetical protein
LALALIAIATGVIGWLAGRPIEHAPGVLASDDPQQHEITALRWRHGEFDLEARAQFEIEARVLSAESYRFDGGAALAPLDLALGWGAMSDSAVLAHFRTTQGARFFTLYPDESAPELYEALRHSTNVHVIPADARIERLLRKTKIGALVHLEGMLVDASRADGFTWHTSLTREDTGDGACELFFVKEYRQLR